MSVNWFEYLSRVTLCNYLKLNFENNIQINLILLTFSTLRTKTIFSTFSK